MSLIFTIPGAPVPFARAGSFGTRRFTPTKQRDYMLQVRAMAFEAMRGAPLLEGPLTMDVRAVYPIPETWSKKRKAAAYWKDSRPDADNIAKAIMDCIGQNESLAGYDKLPAALVFGDDAQVAHLNVVKIYGPVAFVRVSVEALESSECQNSAGRPAAAGGLSGATT